MNNQNKVKRESNIELLRIIAMLIIVLYHFVYHGNFNFDNNNLHINHFWYSFLMIGGKLGVNIFVLISGYFLINNKEIKFDLKHILKFLFQILFYSISIFIIFNVINKNYFNYEELKRTFFPIIFSKWWFASTYFVLYLLHPFINKMLLSLNKKEYKLLLGILIILFSVIPTFFNVNFQVNDLLWFITLYSIAGYIKMFFNQKVYYKRYFLLFFVILVSVYIMNIIFLINANNNLQDAMTYIFSIYVQNKLYMLLMAVSLFIAFKNTSIKYNKLINIIASATFGVYLIHDNYLVRNFLWKNIFQSGKYQTSLTLIPYTLLTGIIVYIICTILELLRKFYIEKPLFKIIEKYKNKNSKF